MEVSSEKKLNKIDRSATATQGTRDCKIDVKERPSASLALRSIMNIKKTGRGPNPHVPALLVRGEFKPVQQKINWSEKWHETEKQRYAA